jgi:hypothetical protein
MGLEIIAAVLACKNGDELFEKASAILKRFNINVCNEDGSYKDIHAVICEVADVINKKR